MKSRVSDPVQDVSFGTALQISLNNYYDLLKMHVGGLAANEFLQLKLVADPVDVFDEDASKGGYRWWSYYNLLVRSDLAIVPDPLANQVQTSAARLASVYGDFLDVLITFVAEANLPDQDVKELASIAVDLQSLRDENQRLFADDLNRWHAYADMMGYAYGNRGQYLKWEDTNGNSGDIEIINAQIRTKLTRRKVILNKQFPDPEDRKIIAASHAFDSVGMQLGYPIHPDYLYSDGQQFSVNYLSQQAGSSNALFDSRRALSWNQTLKYISTTGAGGFNGTFDKNTSRSNSISTDWGASGSVGYYFISASASAGGHTQIQEDFSTALSLTLSAQAAFRVDIIYPPWFDATLFNCKHVKENPKDFVDFFGASGTLLFYPIGLILVRGFSVSFKSSQNWMYD